MLNTYAKRQLIVVLEGGPLQDQEPQFKIMEREGNLIIRSLPTENFPKIDLVYEIQAKKHLVRKEIYTPSWRWRNDSEIEDVVAFCQYVDEHLDEMEKVLRDWCE